MAQPLFKNWHCWKGSALYTANENYTKFVCWSFRSLQHLRAYQYGYQLVTVHTHGDSIVLSHWGNQATNTMTQYSNQSHYPDTELTSPCPILLMLSARIWSDKYPFLSDWFRALPTRPPRPLERVALYARPLPPIISGHLNLLMKYRLHQNSIQCSHGLPDISFFSISIIFLIVDKGRWFVSTNTRT